MRVLGLSVYPAAETLVYVCRIGPAHRLCLHKLKELISSLLAISVTREQIGGRTLIQIRTH